MNGATLPVPGPLWGPYPERSGQARASAPRMQPFAAVRAVVRRLAPGHDARFVSAIRDAHASLRAASGPPDPAVFTLLRRDLRRDGFQDDTLARAFACALDACERVLGVSPYDTQVIAARIVIDGGLAEMATGEGKTLAVMLAAAAAALAEIPVHVMTANDYLAARDAALMGPVYAALGLTTGTVLQGQDHSARRAAYACDVTYCTAREVVFDYLHDGLTRSRDPLRAHVDDLCDDRARPRLRGLCMAIVDEADSILVDEACVPLVLSRAGRGSGEQSFLAQALACAAHLQEGHDFHLDRTTQSAALTAAGAARVVDAVSAGAWRHRLQREEAVTNALAVLHLYQRDRHYLVRDGAVSIVDQTTGRLAEGRAWSRGIHQLIEIKEGARTTVAPETIAQITYQRFFGRYVRLGGMSGTLTEARRELREVYALRVKRVPLRCASGRVTLPARLFPSSHALADAVVARVDALRRQGRAVLVGTDSVSASNALSIRLHEAGIPHALLDARHDGEEARLVAAAGAAGAVTVATNVAGRGTDIPLGEGVAAVGGLHVLSCQVNASRRIDRQLGGRAARQGDPGSVETWIAVDAPLFARRVPRLLRAALRRHAARLPGAVVRALLASVQRCEELQQCAQRRRLLLHDLAVEHQLTIGLTPE